MPVALDLASVEPSGDLEPDGWQWPQQRLLLRLEHAQPRPGALLERLGVVSGDPLIDRGPKFRQRREPPIAERRDHEGSDVPDRALNARLILRLRDPARQHRRGVMRGEFPIRVVENHLTLRRVLDHSRLQVVRDDPRNTPAEPVEHRRVRTQPGLLPHIERRLDERVPRERQRRDEQVDPRRLARDRIGQRHRLPRPVDLDRLSGLVTHPRRRADHQHVPLVGLAEPVIAHRRLTPAPAGVDVLAVQQLQRHPDPGELAMHLLPVRLPVNALVLTAPGEQPRIHLRLLEIGNVVPADPFPVGGIEHRRHRVPRHALRRDLPPREPLRAKPEHQLRLDPAYHPNYSFCRVISHAAEGA